MFRICYTYKDGSDKSVYFDTYHELLHSKPDEAALTKQVQVQKNNGGWSKYKYETSQHCCC